MITFLPRRIGLLGGSFDPAHEGHVHLSKIAKRILKLDEVWWLVSPQNPTKKAHHEDLATRIAKAKQMAHDSRFIRVLDLEQKWRTHYTIDFLKRFKKHFPRTEFIWMMGADNLCTMHQWKLWPEIFQICPLAIFARFPYSMKSMNAEAAIRFKTRRTDPRTLGKIKSKPHWSLIMMPLHSASSTQLRLLGQSKKS